MMRERQLHYIDLSLVIVMHRREILRRAIPFLHRRVANYSDGGLVLHGYLFSTDTVN